MAFVSNLWEKIRSLLGLGRRKASRLVSATVPEARIRWLLKSNVADLRISVAADQSVLARCKRCDCSAESRHALPLVWFRCPTCGGTSFVPVPNLERDAHFARSDGSSFEYEIFYIRDLPRDLPSPFSP